MTRRESAVDSGSSRTSPRAVRPVHAIHVLAGLDPAYGGPSYSVPRLCEALAAAGVVTTLFSVAAATADGCEVCEHGYRDRRFAQDYSRIPILRGLRSSAGLAGALRQLTPES